MTARDSRGRFAMSDDDVLRHMARALDARVKSRPTLAREVVGSGVRATLAKHLSGDLDDATTPLFAEALAAVEAST